MGGKKKERIRNKERNGERQRKALKSDTGRKIEKEVNKRQKMKER
jgi:hypothetical protein